MAHSIAQDVVKEARSMAAQSPIGDSASLSTLATGHSGLQLNSQNNFPESTAEKSLLKPPTPDFSRDIPHDYHHDQPNFTQDHGPVAHGRLDNIDTPLSLPERDYTKSPLSAVQADASGGSDTDTSKPDSFSRKENDGGHVRSNSFKKPTSFKSVSVTKNFLAKAVGTAGSIARPMDRAYSPGPNTPLSLQNLKPRLVAKSAVGGLAKSQLQRAAGSNGPDGSKVWNRNQPVATPVAKVFTDEELKLQYGIHMASKLHNTDEGNEKSKWADIDDDEDDWTPEPSQWVDITKPNLLPVIAPTSSVAPRFASSVKVASNFAQPSKRDSAIKETNQSQPIVNFNSNNTTSNTLSRQPLQLHGAAAKPDHSSGASEPASRPILLSSSGVKAILRPGSHSAGHTILRPGGVIEKNTGPKPPPASAPTQSPWRSLPPIDKVSPVTFTPPLSGSIADQEDNAHDSDSLHHQNEALSSPPIKEIAAEDFKRDWDGDSRTKRHLFNSQSGLMESVSEGRRLSARHEYSQHQNSRQEPPHQLSVLQRQHPHASTRPLASDQPWQPRHRTGSFSSGGRRMSNSSGPPSATFRDGHASRPWPRNSPTMNNAQVQRADGESQENGSLVPDEAAVVKQKQLMDEKIKNAKLQKQRELEAEAREKAERAERLKLKLEALTPLEPKTNPLPATAKTSDGESAPASRVGKLAVTTSPPKPPVPRFEGEVTQYGLMKVHQPQLLKNHKGYGGGNASANQQSAQKPSPNQHHHQPASSQSHSTFIDDEQQQKHGTEANKLDITTNSIGHTNRSNFNHNNNNNLSHPNGNNSNSSSQSHANHQQATTRRMERRYLNGEESATSRADANPNMSSGSWRPQYQNPIISGWSTNSQGNVWAPPQSKDRPPLGNGTFEIGGFRGGSGAVGATNSGNVVRGSSDSSSSSRGGQGSANSPSANDRSAPTTTPGPIAPPSGANNLSPATSAPHNSHSQIISGNDYSKSLSSPINSSTVDQHHHQIHHQTQSTASASIESAEQSHPENSHSAMAAGVVIKPLAPALGKAHGGPNALGSQRTSVTSYKNPQYEAPPVRSTAAEWRAFSANVIGDEKAEQEAMLARARELHGVPSRPASKVVIHEKWTQTRNPFSNNPDDIIATETRTHFPQGYTAEDYNRDLAAMEQQSQPQNQNHSNHVAATPRPASRFFPAPTNISAHALVSSSGSSSNANGSNTSGNAGTTRDVSSSQPFKKLDEFIESLAFSASDKSATPPPPENCSLQVSISMESTRGVVVKFPKLEDKVAVVKLPPSVVSPVETAIAADDKPAAQPAEGSFDAPKDWQGMFNTLLRTMNKTAGKGSNTTWTVQAGVPEMLVFSVHTREMDGILFPDPEMASRPTVRFSAGSVYAEKELATSRVARLSNTIYALRDFERYFALSKQAFSAANLQPAHRPEIALRLPGQQDVKKFPMPMTGTGNRRNFSSNSRSNNSDAGQGLGHQSQRKSSSGFHGAPGSGHRGPSSQEKHPQSNGRETRRTSGFQRERGNVRSNAVTGTTNSAGPHGISQFGGRRHVSAAATATTSAA